MKKAINHKLNPNKRVLFSTLLRELSLVKKVPFLLRNTNIFIIYSSSSSSSLDLFVDDYESYEDEDVTRTKERKKQMTRLWMMKILKITKWT